MRQLGPNVSLTVRPRSKIVPPCPRIPYWNGLGADSEEKREPVSDIDTAVVDGLKVLDPNGRLEKLPRWVHGRRGS